MYGNIFIIISYKSYTVSVVMEKVNHKHRETSYIYIMLDGPTTSTVGVVSV